MNNCKPMGDPLTNPDRDEEHRRRREAGDEDDPDGREVAHALYGGIDAGDAPRCDNCGKAHHNNDDIGCHKCDPRARRGGRPGPVPTPPNQNQ